LICLLRIYDWGLLAEIEDLMLKDLAFGNWDLRPATTANSQAAVIKYNT